MPIYEFSCKDCDKEFETLVLKTDNPQPACPKCGGGNVVRRLSPGSFRPRGIPRGTGGFKPPKCASS